MADIELVIKMPEELLRYFNSFYLMNVNENKNVDKLVEVIKKGKTLQKGHGKIGDLDKLIKHIKNLPKCPNGHSQVYDEAMIINIINDELTIIEADKKE